MMLKAWPIAWRRPSRPTKPFAKSLLWVIVHIASDFIAACLPEMGGTLLGDKSVSAVFDTTKIKRFVPDFCATTPFAEGIRQTVAWFDADPARQQVDAEMDARWDRLIAAYEQGLATAVTAFAGGA